MLKSINIFHPRFPISNPYKVYYQFLNFAMIVSSALMVWKGLFVLSGTGKDTKHALLGP